MRIFPAIDIYEGKAVRLYKGDYKEMTVYSNDPVSVALDFKRAGAEYIHMVDLEGAKDGTTPNLPTVKAVCQNTGLFVEIGGGIRTMEVIEKYLEAGVGRVILGTAAVTDRQFLMEAVKRYGEKIAVGADVRDGKIAIKGWLEVSEFTLEEFFEMIQNIGVKTVICTDISRDGAMRGTNLEMYKMLSEKYSVNIIASGGVSDMNDVMKLRDMELYGAIIGKAYYMGAINLKEAVECAK